jgi:hypothetical protein
MLDTPISEPGTDRVLAGGFPLLVEQPIPHSTFISRRFSPAC